MRACQMLPAKLAAIFFLRGFRESGGDVVKHLSFAELEF